jgi:uncharacterized protein with FMN-binding domain
MTALPPPPSTSTPDPAALRAQRLEQLARRRAASAPDPTTSSERAALDERLARLSRTGSTADDAGRAGRPPRRRHPARGARFAALGISLASTGGLATLFALTGSGSGTALSASGIVTASAASTDAAGATATNTVVDGAVFHNKWGNVQVRATFAPDGALVDVAALQTPNDRGKSIRINDAAVPRLNVEALQAQSAQVDTVSGATYTSNDYRRSLQSAIDAARAAGVTIVA